MSTRSRLLVARVAAATALLAIAGVVVALTVGNGGSHSACRPEVKEPLDSRSLQHVLPGAPAPKFDSAAPTSGPHEAGFVEGGVRGTPIPAPVQVGALESGAVLIQHRVDISAGQMSAVDSLARGRVIVAPNPALDSPIVATAWQVRLCCSRADTARLTRFANDHAGATTEPTRH